MKFRITREEANKRKLTKPIDKVIADKFGKLMSLNAYFVNQYNVDFKLVDTKGLVNMLQNLTIHGRYEPDLPMPTPKTYDRILYLRELSAYCGADVAEQEISELIKNKEFINNRDVIIRTLKEELSTREHIPNKKQSKILRRLKSQGRHIID